ncbi:MAG: HIRAN domain-containing protein [Rhodanobacteraceae bacterium]
MNFIEHVREPHRLLLVWQAAEGARARHAVAELLRPETGPVRLQYLTSTNDFEAARNEGFFNFPAFRKPTQIYDLGVVETFVRRLPPRSRGDYPQYLEKFRLHPETPISDFALLAYTGAKLPSDGFGILDPLDDVQASCELLLEVAGFRHAAQVSRDEIKIGDPVRFVPEPDNPHNQKAVAVFLGAAKIGYIPRQQAPAVQRLVQEGAIEADVERVNGQPERPLIYLFTRLQAEASINTPRRHAR